MKSLNDSKTRQSYRAARMSCALACIGICQNVVCAPIEKVLHDQYIASNLPGLCVASVDAQGTRFAAGQGFANMESRVPYTPDTVQPVGSVSKTFIGLTMADLVVRGNLKLQERAVLPVVGRVISSNETSAFLQPSPPERVITWKQLATHTSGIVDDAVDYESAYVPGRNVATSMAAFVKSYLNPETSQTLSTHFSATAPGQRFTYSNLGAATAAVGLEMLIGVPFDTYTYQHFLLPIGMVSSGWHFDPQLGPRNAILYAVKPGSVGSPLAPYRLVTYADGGLHTSCNDLALYLSTLLRAYAGLDTTLRTDSVRLMLSPQLDPKALPEHMPVAEPNQGLFWQFRRNGSVGHSGSDPGLTAFISLDLKAERGRVFLANGDISERPEGRAAFAEIWHELEQQ